MVFGSSVKLLVDSKEIKKGCVGSEIKVLSGAALIFFAWSVVWRGRKKYWKALEEWIQVHCEVGRLLVEHELAAEKTTKLGFGKKRLRRLFELIAILRIERRRRLEVAEAERLYPDDPNAIYRLHPLQHVSTQRQLRKKHKNEADLVAEMMEKQMKAKSVPIVSELVLVGGGHAHVHVLRMLAMLPIAGVRVTLISKDIETPYSGMLPGHVAGYYTRDECHIDLGKLARCAGIQLIQAQVTQIDLEKKCVSICQAEDNEIFFRIIPYDVLSINVGITPTSATSTTPTRLESRETTGITPVKPIAKFAEAWDRLLLEKVESLWLDSRQYDIVVVGGGAGGVELILAMRARVRSHLYSLGRDPELARFSLLTRGHRILGSHSEGARVCMEKVLRDRSITVVAGCEVIGKAKNTTTDNGRHFLECRFVDDDENVKPLPFDECIWCTQASAPKFLADSGLRCEAEGGFVLVDEYQRCSYGENIILDNVFAVGDCATVIGHRRPKAGVFAVMAGMPLFENIKNALINANQPKRHIPQSSFLGLLGTGDGSCVASRGDLAFEASWLWQLKDWIDRKWMWQYSAGLPDLSLAEELVEAEGAFRSSPQALDILRRSPMRCGGCGAKVGASTLSQALTALPPPLTENDSHVKVLVGVNEPDDGAVVQYQDTTLVHSIDFFRNFLTDPYQLGRVAANHALSDCEAMGAKPVTALALAVIPFASQRSQGITLETLMRGIRRSLDEAGCVLIGGHTCEGSELSIGLSVTGNASTKLLSKGGLRPGDVLILTKPLGTGCVMAADMRAKAKWPCVQATINSMLVSNRAASNIFISHQVNACTDVTGFGLIGHLAEMCRASNGALLELDLSAIPFLPGALDLAQEGIFSSLQPENLNARRAVLNHDAVSSRSDYALLFDPQTAGGLLAAVNAPDAQAVIHRLKAAGYPQATIIGVVQATEVPDHFPAAITIRTR